jgi:hypothetical protein
MPGFGIEWGYMRSLVLLCVIAVAALGQKYTGPRPPKPDLVYLVHADNLIPTEAAEAKQEKLTFIVAGTASSARTPMAEPIFMIDSDKIQPQGLELYKMEIKGGKREVTIVQRRTRGGPRPLRLTVTRLDGKLYKIEADEVLENGQYALSPNGSNTVFCFEVY